MNHDIPTTCEFFSVDCDDPDDEGFVCDQPPTHAGACRGFYVCTAHRCRCASCKPIAEWRAAKEAKATWARIRRLLRVVDACWFAQTQRDSGAAGANGASSVVTARIDATPPGARLQVTDLVLSDEARLALTVFRTGDE